MRPQEGDTAESMGRRYAQKNPQTIVSPFVASHGEQWGKFYDAWIKEFNREHHEQRHQEASQAN